MKKTKENNTPLLVIIVLFFTLGLVLGSVAYFYVPENVLQDVSVSVNDEIPLSFSETMKRNFVSEIFWIIIIWILNNMSMTSPISGGVIAVRGFLIGFSITFINSMCGEERWHFLLCNILPQTLVAIPVLTIFTMRMMRLSVERKERGITDFGYLSTGAIFSIITLLTSALEAGISMVFIKLL